MIRMSDPVVYAEASLSRYTAAGVTSLGLPIRFICKSWSASTSDVRFASLTGGVLCMISTRCGCSCLKVLVMSDSMYPGEIELTLMLCGGELDGQSFS